MQEVIRSFPYKEIPVELTGLNAKTFANINTPAELLAIQHITK
jgi:molybdopterin-guanine dinucleotide biosynthesis protein A